MNESIFNDHIGPAKRKCFLIIILDIFDRIKSFYETCSLDQNIYEKKRQIIILLHLLQKIKSQE